MALIGKVNIVGWRESGFEQGTTHKNMSMEEFVDAHLNHQSTRNYKPCRAILLPQVKAFWARYGFFHSSRRYKGGTCLCPIQVASKVVKLSEKE